MESQWTRRFDEILRFQLSKANLSTAIGIQAIYLEDSPPWNLRRKRRNLCWCSQVMTISCRSSGISTSVQPALFMPSKSSCRQHKSQDSLWWTSRTKMTCFNFFSINVTLSRDIQPGNLVKGHRFWQENIEIIRTPGSPATWRCQSRALQFLPPTWTTSAWRAKKESQRV